MPLRAVVNGATGTCGRHLSARRGRAGTAASIEIVFYLRYVRSELVRRKGRTILTVLGLALGVALAVTMSSLSTRTSCANEP